MNSKIIKYKKKKPSNDPILRINSVIKQLYCLYAARKKKRREKKKKSKKKRWLPDKCDLIPALTRLRQEKQIEFGDASIGGLQ